MWLGLSIADFGGLVKSWAKGLRFGDGVGEGDSDEERKNGGGDDGKLHGGG